MKRVLLLVCLLLIGLGAKADFDDYEQGINLKNFWEKTGKAEEKAYDVGARIFNANRINKRIPVKVIRNTRVANAYSSRYNKSVNIYTGAMLYIDNDDELAYLIGHEMAHSLDSYGGIGKWNAMTFNSRQYEYKADLIGIDLMVKAGYNPIAAITFQNKLFSEPPLDFGLFTSHPKGSNRLLASYKYIYKKYPWALESEMAKNIQFVNFTYTAEKEINRFKTEEQERTKRNEAKEDL